MEIRHQIRTILMNDALDADDCETGKCEEIERLIEVHGWDAIQAILVDMLEDDHLNISDFDVIAQVFWGAVLDKRVMDINKTIALLYMKLPPDDEHLDNLVWSITIRLKGIGYLSDYNPLEDPDVLKEMDKYKSRLSAIQKV